MALVKSQAVALRTRPEGSRAESLLLMVMASFGSFAVDPVTFKLQNCTRSVAVNLHIDVPNAAAGIRF